MFEEAERILDDINYNTLKQAFYQLKAHGYMKSKKYLDDITLAITKEGMARLNEMLPKYKSKRSWDKSLYLVTYDVPEVQKVHRELLRKFINKLGATILQKSVWIIPYNPQETLRAFLEEHNLSGVVIISKLGKDAAIGEEGFKSLIRRLYKLDRLNERYAEYLRMFGSQKIKNLFGATKYLSILRDDPQLPFQLLPDDWLGDKAYILYSKLYFA